MTHVEEFSDFVKGQRDFHARMADKFASDRKRNSLHSDTASKFNDLFNFLTDIQVKELEKPKKMALSWDEIVDLPEELVAELSISDADRTEFNVLQVLEDAGGVASLDRILVGYYRLTGEVMKRPQMNNRIYRMIQKGLMYSVPGKKGVYSLNELTEQEAESIN